MRLYGIPLTEGGYALISYVCSQHCIQSLLRPIDRQAAIQKRDTKRKPLSGIQQVQKETSR